MARLFEIEAAAREAGISSEELAQLEASIRQEYGPDDLMRELRLLRTLRAIQNGAVSIQEEIRVFEATKAMPRIIDWLEKEALSDSERDEVCDFLSSEISRIGRLVLVLYYYEKLTMAQIADRLGTGEERIAEMHAGLLEHMRHRLGNSLASRTLRHAS